MPRKVINFELDFVSKEIFSRFAVKQFDDVSFNIKPKNQGKDYDVTNMTAKIFVGVGNDIFMQTENITVSSDNIKVLLDRNMLQKNGRAYAEIELSDSAGVITSSSFIFDIDSKIGEGATIPGSIEGFVAKYERLISEFKSQVNETISNCNANVDNKLNTVDSLINVKISDFEKRFNRLTSSQQQDAEVIDARTDFKGVVFDSLKERIDYTDKLLRDSTVSTVETESDFTTVEATSNGYFEDVKLEGRTLVNLWGNKSSDFSFSNQATFNESTQCIEITSTANRFSNCFTKNVTMFKPSTQYTLIVNVLENTFTTKSGFLKVNSPDPNNDINISNATPTIIGGFIGIKKFQITTKDDLSSCSIGLRTYIDNIDSEVGAKLKFQIIILEGDHTQNPPSFFEGLKSVGQDIDEIVVKSVNGYGNLFDGELEVGSYDEKTGLPIQSTNHRSINYININNSTEYYFKFNEMTLAPRVFYYDKNKIYISNELITTNSDIKKITVPKNTYFIKFHIGNVSLDTSIYVGKYPNDVKDYINPDKKRLLYYNEETQTWEKPILREWDSIEKHSDGKYYYHQRSGEVVLNGSDDENWVQDSALTKENTIACYSSSIIDRRSGIENLICDTLSVYDVYNTDTEGIRGYSTSHSILIRVKSSKLNIINSSGFKQWLQANPVTVVYQLAEEKAYECTNIDLITYANETNYIVECGVISPKSTLKVHNNISNVVSLLQKKVSLLESNMTSYIITQNRLMLTSRYNADSVSFKVDVATLRNSFEYDNDLYELILNNILVGKDNYDREYIENLIIFYWMDFVISDEMHSTLFEIIEEQHNPKIVEDQEEAPLI